MQFIKPGINIDFIGKRKIAFVFSAAMIVATVVLLIWRGGPNYGVDFSGGVLIQVKLPQKTDFHAKQMANGQYNTKGNEREQ